MFLAYYWNRPADGRAIAERCGVSSAGTTIAGLKSAAQSLEFSAVGFRTSPARLRDLSHPAILLLRGDTDHFVVVLGWSDENQEYLLFDPPNRLRTATQKELDNRFSGIGLAVSDATDFVGVPVFSPRRDVTVVLLCVLLLINSGGVLVLLRPHSGLRNACSFVHLCSISVVALSGCQKHEPERVRPLAQPLSQSQRLEVDVGRVAPGMPVEHVFHLLNDTGGPLTVTDAKFATTCRCRKGLVDCFPTLVPAGAPFQITVSSVVGNDNGRIQRAGRVLLSGSEGQQMVDVIVSAFAGQSVHAIPAQLSFGQLNTPQARRQICIRSDGEYDLTKVVAGIETQSGLLEVTKQSATSSDILLNVSLRGNVQAGDFSDKIIVRLAPESLSDIEIGVGGRIAPDIQATPRVFVLDEFSGTLHGRLQSRSGNPFSISSITSSDSFQISTQSDDEQAEHFVDISVIGPIKKRYETIAIETSLPDQSTVMFHIVRRAGK